MHSPDQQARSRTLDDHFLFSSAREQAETEPTDHPDIISVQSLQKAFPDVELFDTLSHTSWPVISDWPRFGALAFKIEHMEPDSAAADNVVIHLARILQAVCRKTNGIWGRIDHELLGCLVPEKTQSQCMAVAETIKKRFSEGRAETLSVGVAMFPTLSYEKYRIIDNAGKAIAHAAFFGPGAVTAFDAVSLNISGDRFYQENDIDGAISEYRLALMLDPKNINVHNSMGVCHGIRGELDAALGYFTTAMELDTKEIMPVYNVGYVYFLKKDYSRALDYFLQAGQIDAGVFEIALQTGRVYLEIKQPEKGIPHLEAASRLNPKSAAAQRLLGDALTSLNRIAEAETAYKTALKNNPHDAASLSALSALYDARGENADIALMFGKQAVDIDPENGLFQHRLGRLYLSRSRLEEALDAFQQAQDLGHDAWEDITAALRLIRASDSSLHSN
ncbi:MAG: tetratricopeptide repeat protein [Desulfobacteraceae bacterium]|jgi:tetratricopeptide (TPR) repeat protein|nr:MAG: tetratricopeptide repeat protein [Desulfobacteraceae bacterium]